MMKDTVEKIVNSFKKDKKMFLTITLGITGMLLIMLSSFSDGDTDLKLEADTTEFYNESEICYELKNMLEQIKGAGKVSVMITYEEGREKVFATDSEIDKEEKAESVVNEYIIIDSQNGETGLEVKTIYPKVKGVAVVCQGADSNVVKEQIIDMVSALFDINSSKISVAVMNE